MNTKEYSQKYYLEHREHMLEMAKKNRLKYNYKKTNEKAREYNKKYKKTHPEKFKLGIKRNHLKQFGITVEDYNKMFDKQNGCCAICGKHQSEFKIAFAVDHNHKTGKVRGLLCSRCNTMLGFASDNINILKAAINYLEIKI